MPGEKFKDLFSVRSNAYARYRPKYPRELFQYLVSLVETTPSGSAPRVPSQGNGASPCIAWDVGTGSGQSAILLSDWVDEVWATDPSQSQLANAVVHDRVKYQVASAEQSGFPEQSVDLITAAQAFHWFNQPAFFEEAKRVLKPGGIVAVWSYGLAHVSPEIDMIILKIYRDDLQGYWEPERKQVEQGYRNASSDLPEVKAPPFEMVHQWDYQHLLGYIRTWSAVQTYIKKNGLDPVSAHEKALKQVWGDEEMREVRWKLALRIWKVER